MGEPRRLDGAVGADPGAVRRDGRRVRTQLAADAEGQRARRAGLDRRGIPVLHSDDFEQPVPLAVISTAGAEDSPFIPSGSDELYFVFVKDVREEVHIQIRDPANGIWRSSFVDGSWQEPELVVLQDSGKLALNGCTFVDKDFMLFCTAREGFTGLHWFSAEKKDARDGDA